MPLSWSHATDIAHALIEHHPDAVRVSLTHDNLLGMIQALPGFSDTPVPPKPAYLDHILWTWMRLADEQAVTSA